MNDKPFIHLRTQSSYSLSESAIKIDKLVEMTKDFNMPAVALTDNNNMFGALEFSIKSSNKGIQPIIGTTINLFINDLHNINNNININQVTLLAKNQIGYTNLLHLSSKSHIENSHNMPGLFLKDIINYKEGLIIYLGGSHNPIIQYLEKNKIERMNDLISTLKNEFKDNLLFEIQRIQNNDFEKFEDNLINLSIEKKIPLIATNNVQYPDEEYFESHDSLICIAEKTKLVHEKRKKSNPNLYFKSSEDMYELFKDIPQALENTLLVAQKCNYFPLSKKPKLPKYETNNQFNEKEELIDKSTKGLDKRIKYNSKFTKEKIDIYKKRLEYELRVINDMGFAGYFLIVSDFIKWAKNNNIPVGPGRGSGAGSLVAWSLTITDLDPINYGLIFERFLNPERISLPDFDIDFCQDRRDEVIDYVEKKYGKNSVARIITFGTLSSRAVIRDLGRVHDIPYLEVDRFSKMIPYNPANPITLSKSIEIEPSLKRAINNDERLKLVIDQGLKLEGLYRHASTHAAGVVISDTNLQKEIPLYKDPKTQKINTQFSMTYVELSGLIKFDFLGLTTLTIINQATKLINKSNKEFDINMIPLDDKKTFEMLSYGKTAGVFQLESSGMKDVLKRLKPDRFEEIIAVVALFRPGPMDNIPSYCNRKHKIESIDYLHPLLEPALKETYGIIVYQEQVLQIAQILSGYSLGEADILRKAMGKKITKEMKAQKDKFIQGAINKGLSSNQASTIFELVDKFAGYGFNKCHAAGYALIAYQTAYLKNHFTEEFLVSSMNLSINKTENLVMFKKEIDELKIKLLKPDINKSESEFSIEMDKDNRKCIRFGLAGIKGVGFNAMINLVNERKLNGSFKNVIDFVSRLKSDVINKKQLEKLIQSGSFDSIESNRCYLFENVTNLIDISNSLTQNKNQTSLFKYDSNDYIKNLKNYNEWNMTTKLKYEFEVIGYYLSSHPLSLYSKQVLNLLEIKSYEQVLNENKFIRGKIAGSVLDIKERTSKDGNKYAFVAVSDSTQHFELTIFGDTLRSYSNLLEAGNTLLFDIDLSSNKDRGERLIIRKIQSLREYILGKNFEHCIYLDSIKDLELIKNYIVEKKSNNDKIYISIKKNNLNVKLSLPDQLSISDFNEMDDILSSKNIIKTTNIIN
ncbi:MAG: DNA polymerase III subunit alpha [Pelagibacteraceae bacterium]|nr:DNA polymerase III subunit alpha [Pelagibacteraceae bacterium]|tara:strand:+ start:2305 stop:5739 length:3435 start_codon:yes stop_codon:yes gene_type:complete